MHVSGLCFIQYVHMNLRLHSNQQNGSLQYMSNADISVIHDRRQLDLTLDCPNTVANSSL